MTDIITKPSSPSSTEPFAAVEAGHIKDKHGNIDGWKGGVYDFASNTPDLYEMLIEEKKMRPGEPEKGVPDLPGFDRDVWAALSESEACLKGINTWDTAFVTIGPIQQTLGTGGAKGELQGALHTAWRSAPEAYKRRLGRHGLQPKGDSVDIIQGAKKAHVTFRGEPLDSAAKKKQLQRFVWVDRLAEAFGDPSLRYWMLKEGFKRIERLRNRKMTLSVGEETIKTTIGELFRRDLSQALLLDWHVNAPSNVWASDNDWIGSVEMLLNGWDDIAQSKNLSLLTKNRELQLVASLLEDRLGNMTDATGRAIGILKYTENKVVEEMAKADTELTYEGVPTFLERRLGLDSTSANENWSDIQAHQRKVLSFDRN